MKLPESLGQFLTEFVDDGGKWQLSREEDRTWTTLMKQTIKIGQFKCIQIEAGWTSPFDDQHTAVINVTVSPIKLQNAAEDQATETITVYYADFKTVDEAKAALQRVLGQTANEMGSDLSNDLSVQLNMQRPPGTIAI